MRTVVHWKILFLRVGLAACCSQPLAAQDSVYTHWPSVEETGFDEGLREQVFHRLEKMMLRPAAPLRSAAPKENSKGPGWPALDQAGAFMRQQRFAEASQAAVKALNIARRAGDKRLEMKALGLTGAICRDVFLGASLQAVPYHEEALALARELKDTVFTVRQLLALADNYGQAGRNDRFLAYLDSAAQLLLGFELPDERMRLGIQFAIFSAETGRPQQAEVLFRQALQIGQALRDTATVENLYWQLFSLHLSAGAANRAAAALDSAAAIAQLSEEELYEAKYQLEKLRGNREQAFQYLEKAYRKIGSDYMRRNADQLASWETQLRTREKELQLESQRVLLDEQKRTRRLLYSIIVLVSLLSVGSLFAWYIQRQSKRALSHQNQLIERQAAELQQLDRLKTRFFANVSHELRTPITLILGPIEQVLKNKGLNAGAARALQTAHRNAQQLLTFVQEILDLSRLQSAGAELREQATRLVDFLEETVQNFQPLAESRQIELAFDYHAAPDWTLELDRDKLLKILNNLLGNALKFTPAGGRIVLRAEQQTDELLLSVRDTGPGIHSADLPHIFDLYYQSKYPEAKIEGGTGIGLALARELAQLMGGQLRAESAWGEGSIFYLALPVRECSADSAAPIIPGSRHTRPGFSPAPTSERPAPGPEGPQLLVVEDNGDLREFLHLVLSGDYQPVFAENGQAALEYLQKTDRLPELILSDVMMPLMDGFQLLEQLRAHHRWRYLPVILLTARAELGDRLRAFRTGVDDYLLKPFSEEELLARIENALRNQASRREWAEIVEPSGAKMPATPEDAWVHQLETCVLANLANFQFNVDHLAELMGMSRASLYRRVRETSGLSVNQYLQEIRLQRARVLLETGQVDNLRELAEAVGFRTSDYLSRLYRERFGKSPAEMR